MQGRQPSFGRDDSGSVSTEVVLVVPALLLLVLLSVQFGLWYHASAVAKAAAEEGARAARAEGATAPDGEARARSFLAQAGPTIIERAQVTATRTAATAGVEVRGVAVNVVPGFRLPVNAVAASPVERYRSPIER